jgi:hypothetical protein
MTNIAAMTPPPYFFHVSFSEQRRCDGLPFVSDFLAAARCPAGIELGPFGPWQIVRKHVQTLGEALSQGNAPVTFLRHAVEPSMANMHLENPHQTVMDDGRQELKRHLPIWLAARGRVLITGLGLGCVVRGLLASPAVEHIDVVEIDALIIERVGREFAGDPRVTIHHADALTWTPSPGARFDFGWHDLWLDGEGLQLQHMQLVERFQPICGPQGAWDLPRWVSRRMPHLVELNAKKRHLRRLAR